MAVRPGTVEHWVKAQPRLLLCQGQWQQEALQQARVTESGLRAALRAQGMTALEDVEAVVLETEGSFSIIKQRVSSSSALADVQGYPPGTSDVRRGQ